MNTLSRLTAVLLVGAATLPALAQDKGKTLFEGRCIACHGPGGAGIPGLAPPLAGALPYLDKPAGRDYVLGVLTHGLSGKIVSKGQTFIGAMPAQADLSDDDLAAVANHLAGLNGQPGAPFKPDDVARLRQAKLEHKALRDQRGALNP